VIYDPVADTFTSVGNCTPSSSCLGTARRHHTAHLLTNGSVLIVGGFDASNTALRSLEYFDPAGNGGAGAFAAFTLSSGDSSGGGMWMTHAMHASVALPNATLLVTGGCTTSNCTGGSDGQHAEIITISNAATGTTNKTGTTGTMQAAHYQHTATVFDFTTSSGKTLIAGGATSAYGNGTNVGEVFEGTNWTCVGSATGTCTSPATMATARSQHAAALLPNGDVAVFGGLVIKAGSTTPASMTNTIELYVPTLLGSFQTSSTSLGIARFGLTATTLGGAGRILVAGGFIAAVASTGKGSTASARLDLFDVSGTTLTAVVNPTNMDNLSTARGGHFTTLLFDTTTLIAGGTTSTTAGGELFTSFQ
jgi:hypothetical protein